MPKTLTLLHTAPIHVQTFKRLLEEMDADAPVRHVVEEGLLKDALAAGEVTPAMAERVRQVVGRLTQEGAGVILCTCSTIGGCAESAAGGSGKVIRVDRPMAERAVQLGERIIVAATLQSTLLPTCDLVRDCAEKAGKGVTIIEAFMPSAWERFTAGDEEGYLKEIAEGIREAAPLGDVVVLAQASMAGAARYCPDITIPILSSPRLGLEAALAAL